MVGAQWIKMFVAHWTLSHIASSHYYEALLYNFQDFWCQWTASYRACMIYGHFPVYAVFENILYEGDFTMSFSLVLICFLIPCHPVY